MSITPSLFPRLAHNIPIGMRPHIPAQLRDEDIARCPVIIKRDHHHILYDSHRTSASTHQPHDLIPSPTRYCWLLFPENMKPAGKRFLGQVLRVAEYQESHVIVIVQHISSPALLSLKVPYEYFVGEEQSLWCRLICALAYRYKQWHKPNSGAYLPGKYCHFSYKLAIRLTATGVSLDPVTHDWEIDDRALQDYSPVWRGSYRGLYHVPCL